MATRADTRYPRTDTKPPPVARPPALPQPRGPAAIHATKTRQRLRSLTRQHIVAGTAADRLVADNTASNRFSPLPLRCMQLMQLGWFYHREHIADFTTGPGNKEKKRKAAERAAQRRGSDTTACCVGGGGEGAREARAGACRIGAVIPGARRSRGWARSRTRRCTRPMPTARPSAKRRSSATSSKRPRCGRARSRARRRRTLVGAGGQQPASSTRTSLAAAASLQARVSACTHARARRHTRPPRDVAHAHPHGRPHSHARISLHARSLARTHARSPARTHAHHACSRTHGRRIARERGRGGQGQAMLSPYPDCVHTGVERRSRKLRTLKRTPR